MKSSFWKVSLDVKRLTQYLDTKSAGRPLMIIPRVGPRTAKVVLAHRNDIARFGNYKQYCSYFGLTPKLEGSGTWGWIGHISKRSPGVVRRVLYESSWKIIRHSNGLRSLNKRVMSEQKGQ